MNFSAIIRQILVLVNALKLVEMIDALVTT